MISTTRNEYENKLKPLEPFTIRTAELKTKYLVDK
jgi:hypothetical protein